MWYPGSALFFIKQTKPSSVDFCYTLYEYIILCKVFSMHSCFIILIIV